MGGGSTTGTVSNLGFLGLPLILAFFGDRGAGPLAMAILAEVMVLLSVGGVQMSASSREGISVGRLVLRGTVLNPSWPRALGAVIAAVGLSLPEPVARFLGFLGMAAGPTALFALGGALAAQRINRATLLAPSRVTTAKLLLYPVAVWSALDRLLALDHIWVQTLSTLVSVVSVPFAAWLMLR